MNDSRGLLADGVSFSWKDKSGIDHDVLKNITLKTFPHEFLAIVGPSGCGKTTLLHLLSGIITPTTGTIWHNGKKLQKPTRKIGMVFQDYSLFPWLTAKENIAFGLNKENLSKESVDEKVEHLLKQVGLLQSSDKYPHELSGGMRQRIAIGRAIAGDADYILMDEPFGALDHFTRMEMQNFLRHIWETFHKTVIFVTHSIEEALLLANRVFLMKSGSQPKEIILPKKEYFEPKSQAFQEYKEEILHFLSH